MAEGSWSAQLPLSGPHNRRAWSGKRSPSSHCRHCQTLTHLGDRLARRQAPSGLVGPAGRVNPSARLRSRNRRSGSGARLAEAHVPVTPERTVGPALHRARFAETSPLSRYAEMLVVPTSTQCRHGPVPPRQLRQLPLASTSATARRRSSTRRRAAPSAPAAARASSRAHPHRRRTAPAGRARARPAGSPPPLPVDPRT